MDKKLSNKPSYIIGRQNEASRSHFEKTRKFVFWGVKSIDVPNGAKIANLRFKGKGLDGI